MDLDAAASAKADVPTGEAGVGFDQAALNEAGNWYARVLTAVMEACDCDAKAAGGIIARLSHSGFIIEDADQWRPIETAPKSGESVLLWFPEMDDDAPHGAIEGWWFESPKKDDDGWETIVGFIGEPKHWRPLESPTALIQVGTTDSETHPAMKLK